MEPVRVHVETRSELQGNRLTGYAAVYDQATKLASSYEALAAGAFDQVLERGDDVRALFEHNPGSLLGRTSSGTLRLWSDSQGLGFELDLPRTSLGNDVRELAERGDLTGASVGFVPEHDRRDLTADGLTLRTHTSVKMLRDVSPVTFPQYEGTSVMLRSLELATVDHGMRNRARLIRARHTIRIGENQR